MFVLFNYRKWTMDYKIVMYYGDDDLVNSMDTLLVWL